ncbi:MAG TPA: iron-sulfur cluster assembly scaffold protein [Halanaerobiales bacterium]|nr:iron-sulfur cluster assembly scaffold protein [Halanaerobiales bacterium]
MYTKEVMEHFQNPRNVGDLDNPDLIGEASNDSHGDIIKLYINTKDNIITDIRFKTFGCAAAVATSSMFTVLAKGKKINEALEISKQDIADALGELPNNKMECSNLAPDAFKKAVED